MKLRAVLFAPGDSERKSAKALAGDADAVVLDLEDAVGIANKDAARATVAAVLRASTRPGLVVRVNARGTPWYLADLAAAVPGRPEAVMLPKCTGPDDLRALDHHLEALEAAEGLPIGGIGVLALVTETAASMHALDYRGVSGRLRAMCFGSEDLSSDLGVVPRDGAGAYSAAIIHARGAMLLAAAAADVPALDTPFPDPRDPAGLEREARCAARDGFAGKLCIHPAQVEVVKAAFTPPPDRVRWAEAVRDAFAANPQAGVLALDGRMVERLHLRLAERILRAIA